MKIVRCFWRTDRTCPRPALCRYGYDCVAKPKGRATMKRRLTRALLGTALLTTVALAPSVAAPGASAHVGYAGYGCSGWTQPAWNYVVQDCYAGQQSYPYVLIFHDYQGIAAPSDFYSWERLY